MGKIILGLFLVAAGATITIKSEWLYQNFGGFADAERYLGAGGARLAYKLIGIVMSIVGFLIMTNLIEGVLLSFVKLFIPGVK
ncbi:MAG: hypothetical protein UY34_C0016G0001 [Parcubacteria group bacterium GW2011_GWA2_48_9]|nr:MAG: hypothetical protein UY34_C0016G0001 [Parcubacteria group bacterium GW2011_GWA2_48_9]